MGEIITSMTTYTGKQSEFNQLIAQKFKNHPTIASLGFSIEEDIQSVKKLYKAGYLEKITQKRTGCSTVATETGTGVAIESFDLSVTDMQIQLPLCADVFDSTIAEVAKKKGYDINNLEGTQIETLLAEMIVDAAALDLYRQIFLNDTSLTNTNYTAYDGIFKKLKAGYLASDGTAQADGTITDTEINLTNIITTLNNVIDAQPSELKYMPENMKVMYVTNPVFQAYKRYLQSTAFSGVAAQRESLINGLDTLSFDGITMVNLGVINKYLELDFTSGSPATAVSKNRIILTVPENHFIGTDMANDSAKLMFWYDPKDDTNYTRLRYKVGYNYAFGNLNVIAGF